MFLFRSRSAGPLSLALALAPAPAAWPAETLSGPYRAEVERVVDGDTLAVRVAVWLGQELRVLVRIRGIDAPEMRARCPRERELAREAAEHLTGLVGGGPVDLTNIAGGKYYGRVVADASSAGSGDLAAAMVAPGLARRYEGGARAGWCDGEEETASTAGR
jgi:micrococcal nuclease